jgi:hypothetical protein
MSSDNERQNMKTVSIGFTREDGDFELLATMNNTGDVMTNGEFMCLVNSTRSNMELMMGSESRLEVLERADAPDVVSLE